MHDLQTINRINAPVNQRTKPVILETQDLLRQMKAQCAQSEPVPAIDQVQYA